MRPQRERALELLHGALRALAVGLVDDQDVGDLQQPRLHGLNVIAEAGRGDEDAHVGHLGDVDLALAGADGLDQNDVLPRRVQRIDDAHRRRREAAQVAAARQRAHEDAVVLERGRHADAVAQDGTARYGARGVHGDDADRFAFAAQVARVGVDERRLAGPRRAREADHERSTEVGLHQLEQARHGLGQPLELGHGARDGPALARPHALDQARQARPDRRAWGFFWPGAQGA